MGSIIAITSQHARCGIVHERDVGNVDIGIIEGGSSKLEHVGEGDIGITTVKASEAPIQFYSVQGGVMSIERVISGVSEFGGDNTTDKAGPYLITFCVITVFVKGDKNERIFHESCIGKSRLEETVEPSASETTIGVVTVISDVGRIKRVGRDVVILNVHFEKVAYKMDSQIDAIGSMAYTYREQRLQNEFGSNRCYRKRWQGCVCGRMTRCGRRNLSSQRREYLHCMLSRLTPYFRANQR